MKCKPTFVHRLWGTIFFHNLLYSDRQYGSNYHLLNTIAEYKPFEPQGKTGLRKYVRSKWCQKNEVSRVFEDLVKDAKFKYVFLSYNNEGLMSVDEVRRIMEKYGRYELSQIAYQRFKADKTEARNHKAVGTSEYLHILEKN
ncbi:MAG: DNA adenine methylase [Acidobacteria bacterium]|nr:DNA adenine methylase [Acidobacteriota bacterium]MBK9528047.1 DNA adenine methylase [Acidobacteriota bacterium]